MKSKSIFPKILGFFILAALGYYGYVFYQDNEGPSVILEPNTGFISPESNFTLKLEDSSKIRSVEVLLHYRDQEIQVFSKHYSQYQEQEEVPFSFKSVPVPEGEFELEIKAKDASVAMFGLGNTTVMTLPVVLDSQPPKVIIHSPPAIVRRGGSGVVRYGSNEDILHSGVQVGEHFFPGFIQQDKSVICYFAFPHFIEVKDFAPKLIVRDLAGNTVEKVLNINAADRKFKTDTIQITDKFLEQASQKLYELAPNADDPLERFLIINSDIRLANTSFLFDLGQKSDSVVYWEGPFKGMPRAASRAGYGEYRSYMYKGKVIDNQWHLGHDLASVKEDKVPAANHGKIVFIGNLGIYGNLVVIDHGLGLMSLYSHLTDIFVENGDMVKKGDTVGTTGISGMAFGDHVHFGILIGGFEVTPLEWLDPKWIKNNVTDRLVVR